MCPRLDSVVANTCLEGIKLNVSSANGILINYLIKNHGADRVPGSNTYAIRVQNIIGSGASLQIWSDPNPDLIKTLRFKIPLKSNFITVFIDQSYNKVLMNKSY